LELFDRFDGVGEGGDRSCKAIGEIRQFIVEVLNGLGSLLRHGSTFVYSDPI